MNLPAQRLTHLSTSNICDRVQSKAVKQLVVVQKIFSYAVDDQVQKFMLLMKEESHGEVADLFFRVFVR